MNIPHKFKESQNVIGVFFAFTYMLLSSASSSEVTAILNCCFYFFYLKNQFSIYTLPLDFVLFHFPCFMLCKNNSIFNVVFSNLIFLPKGIRFFTQGYKVQAFYSSTFFFFNSSTFFYQGCSKIHLYCYLSCYTFIYTIV